MIEYIFTASMLINVAALLYFIGFMVRDELILRLLVLSGTVFYLIYYFTVPGGPLWNAIVTSSILGLANIWVLAKIVFERTTLALSENEKLLFEQFENLNPGQFRKIMKYTKWVQTDTAEILCKQNDQAHYLYYLLHGKAILQKGNNKFPLKENNFIGEIAFILGKQHSATAIVEADCCYIKWNTEELKKLMDKNTNLANAVNSIFNHDIASKLSASYQ